MEIGDWVIPSPPTQPYRITLHGPMIEMACVGCGVPTYGVQRTGRIGAGGLEEDNPDIPPRCTRCARQVYGLS
jgi:NAD-dependent SIR2 family protein deacetylase